VETDDLTGNSWQAVAGPFTYSNGMVLHPEPSANGARFYKLKRAAKQ
jgi:hypothetical protein